MIVLPSLNTGNTSLAQVVVALSTVAVSALLVSSLSSLPRKLRIAKGLAPVPGPKGVFLFGIMPELVKNLSRFYHYQEELMKKYGGRVSVPWNLFSNGMLYIASAEDVQHVLSTNFNNYIHSQHFADSFGVIFAKSFLAINHAHTADNGELWRVQRKLAAKVFTTNNFKLYSEQLFSKYAETMVQVIRSQDGKCNMHEISSQYTLQAIFDITCGIPLKEVDDQLGMGFVQSLNYIAKQTVHRLMIAPYFQYFAWCMPSEIKMKRHEKAMIEIADRILEKRLGEAGEEIAPRSDIVSLFIKKARELEDAKEGASILDVDTLRSVFLTFIFAGWETTSSTITWAFYVLVQYPEIQQKVLEELQALTKPALSYDDVKKLKYLDAVVNETLRLYPSAVFDLKIAAEDDHLPDDTFVPAGTEVMFSMWYMGRNNAKLWGDDQLVFRPERWLEMKTRPSAYEFPVFQGGPRICPGMNMALLETKIFIATLLPHFHVQIQDGEQLQDRGYSLSTTLTMEGGLPLQLTPRV